MNNFFPTRWPNPIYLGAYGGGLFSTIACYIISVEAYRHEYLIVSLVMWIVAGFHIGLFYKLITGLFCVMCIVETWLDGLRFILITD